MAIGLVCPMIRFLGCWDGCRSKPSRRILPWPPAPVPRALAFWMFYCQLLKEDQLFCENDSRRFWASHGRTSPKSPALNSLLFRILVKEARLSGHSLPYLTPRNSWATTLSQSAKAAPPSATLSLTTSIPIWSTFRAIILSRLFPTGDSRG